MRVDDTAITQDDSGELHAHTIFEFTKAEDKPIEKVTFKPYREWVDNEDIEFQLGSPDQFYSVLEDIVEGKYDEESVYEVADRFYDDGEEKSIAEKTGNTFEFRDFENKYDRDIEFPVECRSCGENDRMEGSMVCEECKEDLHKQAIEGYPDVPTQDTPEEVINWLYRLDEEYDASEEDEALLYQLLGSGTPEWKMSKEDADYKSSPEGNAYCGNCEYAYYSNQSGEFICSKVRGKVEWEGWCRLWDHAEPDELLQEEFGVPEQVEKDLDGGWVPYVGPRGGTGWRNNETENITYDDDPPGDLAVDQLSSDEKRDIRNDFNERGESVDHILYDEGEVVPIDDRSVGESFLYNTSNGWKEMTITEKRLDGPGPDLIVEDGYGDARSINRDQYQIAASKVQDVPDTIEESVGSVQMGKRIHIEGWEEVAPNPHKSYTDSTIEMVDNNLVQVSGGGTILLDDDHGPMVKWDSVMDGEEYIHPEHGKITYTGETGDRSYNDYIFETEDGEEVNVMFSEDGEELYMPVDISLPEPEYHLTEFSDEERPETIRNTVESIVAQNKVGISQVTGTVRTRPGEDVNPVASYSPSSSTVSFNPEAMNDENLQKSLVKAYDEGFLAGSSIEHAVCHELGHALHAQMGGKPDESDWREYPDRDMIEEQLGEYAASSPGELVAEVAALILQGHDIEEEMSDVYELYLKYGGPEQEEVTSI